MLTVVRVYVFILPHSEEMLTTMSDSSPVVPNWTNSKSKSSSLKSVKSVKSIFSKGKNAITGSFKKGNEN